MAYESQAKRLIELDYLCPLRMVLKCSHTFNLLDARGAISVTERASPSHALRALAKPVAQAYLDCAKSSGPMLKQQTPIKKKVRA